MNNSHSIIQNFKHVIHYSAQFKGLVLGNCVVLLVAAGCESFGIGLMVPLLESISGGTSQIQIFVIFQQVFAILGIPYEFSPLIIIFGILILMKYALIGYQQHLGRLLNAKIAQTLMDRGFANLMDVPISYYYKNRVGDLVATEFTSARNAGALLEYGLMIVRGSIFAITYFVMGCLISIPFTAFICLLAGISYLFIVPLFKKVKHRGFEEKEVVDSIHSMLFDTLGGIRIVKGFNNELKHIAAYKKLTESFKELNVKIMDNKIVAALAFEPLVFTLLVVSLLYAVNVLYLSLAPLITLLFIFMKMTPEVKMVNNNFMQINEFLSHFGKIHELITREGKAYLPVGNKSKQILKDRIRMNNLSFRYPGASSDVLKRVSLDIRKNTTTALVGSSGSGKSTLIDMILRHHDPIEGEIHIDDQRLQDIKINDWRAIVSVVDQDPYLFNESIRENILYGKFDATEEDLLRAAELANAHEFIESLSHGYDTVVGLRGMTLSGGQKQRLALARALIRNPQILILDEATSSLDSESERLIQNSITKFQGSKTMVIIAHRLSTIIHADNILLIENGEIKESGNHSELLERAGRYKELYDFQYSQVHSAVENQ